MDGDPPIPRELHRLRIQHLRSGQRQLLHLLVRQLRQPPRVGDNPRVRAEDAVDIGADLAEVGLQRRRQCHGGRVASPAPERRHFLLPGDALVAGDDHDLAALERLQDPHGPHFDDAGVGVRAVGDDSALRSREADGVHSLVVQGHAEERHRDPLARREQHVQLAPVPPIAETTTRT